MDPVCIPRLHTLMMFSLVSGNAYFVLVASGVIGLGASVLWAAQGTLLKRVGGPVDIVGAALLLASRAGGYITGVALPVEGGVLLREGWRLALLDRGGSLSTTEHGHTALSNRQLLFSLV